MNAVSLDRNWCLRCGWRVTLFAWFIVSNGCRDTAAPPHLARDLGTDAQPLLPMNGPWTNAAIREGQAEWVPLRAPASTKKGASAEGAPEGETEPAPGTGAEAEVAALLEEYNKFAREFNTNEMVTYFVSAQEAQLRTLYEGLSAARDAAAKLKERLLQQEGADAEGINAAFEKVERFSSGMLTPSDTHGDDEKNIHITFEGGQFLPSAYGLLEGSDWYLKASGLPSVEAIKGLIAPLSERLTALNEGDPKAADVTAALAALEWPMIGSPDAHETQPPDTGAASPEQE